MLCHGISTSTNKWICNFFRWILANLNFSKYIFNQHVFIRLNLTNCADALSNFDEKEKLLHAKETKSILELFKASQLSIFQDEPILDRIYAWTSTYLKEELVNGLILDKSLQAQVIFFFLIKVAIWVVLILLYMLWFSNKTLLYYIFAKKKVIINNPRKIFNLLQFHTHI